MRIVLAILLLTSTVFAAEPHIQRDVPYAEPKNERQMLDVYSPAEGKNHPIVVWIHGGGWRAGSKAGMQNKPQAFVDKGVVFVSTTYRFVPNVTVKEMTGDVAKAIRWAHDHAKEFGGDPDTIFVMGHSAGAHLAALVCTDDSYLKAEGLSLSIIRGCVPVDVSVYDIPKRLKDGGSVSPAVFKSTFGETEESQREFSPVAHIARDKHIPPFLILYVATRPDTKAQSQWLADKLHEAGVAATVVPAEGKTHGTINSDLGLADDKPTKAVFEFLDGVLPLSRSDFVVEGRRAFIIAAKHTETGKPTPWVWYAPTLPGLPGDAERWMFDRFTASGIAIAGIDVGESFGSPDGRKLYTALYNEMVEKRGFVAKPVMMGRSRGGLMALCWAAENPEKVAGFAGIYPVCNLASYPGIGKAAGAYHLTPEELEAHLAEHNPIDRLAGLAKAHVPLFAIQGDSDKTVPLEANSGEVAKRYRQLGGEMQLIVPPGQGHNMWPGFFQSQELVDFVLRTAREPVTESNQR